MSIFKNGFPEQRNYNKLYFIQAFPVLITCLMSLFIFLFSKFLPYHLPLFYSLPWGDSRLAIHQQFFIIPGILILITLGNLVISWQLHPTQHFFKKILLFSTLVNAVILTTTFIKIMLIFI